MKILQSLYKRNKIISYYTGSQGTYASVKPIDSTASYVQECCERANWLGFKVTSPLDYHATVIRSTAALSWQQQLEVYNQGFGAGRVFTGSEPGFTHWAGSDDAGFVVMTFQCPELQLLNKWLRETYDMPVSFPEYKPHVSIAVDAYSNSIDYADKLVQELNKINKPKSLTFSAMRIEDIS